MFRAVAVAAAVCLAWPSPASASPVCAQHVVVGRLCVQPDPDEPVTCEQTGMLATCDLMDSDPCDWLSVCHVCPTNDPCPPPTRA